MTTENKATTAIELLPDETILWQAEAKPFKYFAGADGKKAIAPPLISIFSAAVILVAYLVATTESELKFIIGILAILLIVLGSPVSRYRRLNRQEYFITDRRVLVRSGRNLLGAMEIKDIDAMEVFHRDDSTASLALGKAVVEEGVKQLRWRGVNPLSDDDHVANVNAAGLVLYSVCPVDAALAAIGKAKE